LKKLFAFTLLLVAGILPVAMAKDNYTIGFLGNSENSRSISVFNAVKLAADEFNNTMTAYSVNAVFIEDTTTAVDAVKNQPNMIGLIGSFSSLDGPVLDAAGDMPELCVSGDYPGLGGAAKKNIFRLCASDNQLARDTCRFLITVLSNNRLAVIYSGDNNGFEDMAAAFKSEAERNHITPSYYKEVDTERKDFTAVLLRLRDLRVQNIYFAGPAGQAGLLARQSSEMNVGADFSSTSLIGIRSFIKTAKAGSRGAVYASISPSSIYGFRKFENVYERYRKIYKGNDMHIPYAYDAAQLLLSALSSGKTGHADISAYLHGVGFDGATGNITFNESGERSGAPRYFYIIIGNEPLQRNLSQSEYKAFEGDK
jgi:ABC-type branched-subunit amino acid transport system substrate-binding protein